MKKLYIVRHAKSSWKFDVIDHDRPLNDRGLSDAPLVAKHIAKKFKTPDLFLSSDALRAKTTAVYFAQAFQVFDKQIELDHKLYDFAGKDLVEVVHSLNDMFESVMLFGHNNAITNFVNTYGDMLIDNVATTGFTAIEFDITSWKDLKPGKTIYTIVPKELK